MENKVDFITLKNGLTVIAEQMPNVNSIAFDFRIPVGAAMIDDKYAGAASVISDWLFRGTQSLTSRELIEKFDYLGIHHSGSANTSCINLSAVLESGNFASALELLAQVMLTPRFDQDQFDLSKETSIQEIVSLDDDPRQKVMLRLKEQFYPKPFSNNPMGTIETLKALESGQAADIYKKNLDLSRTIISIAGKYNLSALKTQIDSLFSGDYANHRPDIIPSSSGAKYTHEHHEGSQLHIGLITPTVQISNPDYYNAVAAATILGGGMSSRLFTEVREKRGLCYSVGSKYQTLKDYAGIACYAGTTPDKAQETLDVIVNEFSGIAKGISQDELDRAKVGLKSSLIMSSESSSARSSNLGSDFYLLGKIRSLDEIKQKIESLTTKSVIDFIQNNPLNDFTIFTIGPKKITPPSNN
jgi:predicted Zn-dependent peptidase